MSVWMVMLIFGKVAMVAGPLPFDMKKCEQERVIRVADLKDLFSKQDDVAVSGTDRVKSGDVDLKCVRQSKSPKMEYDLEIVP